MCSVVWHTGMDLDSPLLQGLLCDLQCFFSGHRHSLVDRHFGLGIVTSSWCMTDEVPCCGVMVIGVAPCPVVINKSDFFSAGIRKFCAPVWFHVREDGLHLRA